MSRFSSMRCHPRHAHLFIRSVAGCCVIVLLSARLAHAATMDWVSVGNPGNKPDSAGFGAVNYGYQISKFEVTNAQYTEFLNDAAASDPFELYDPDMAQYGIQRTITSTGFSYSLTESVEVDWGQKPVNLVSWYDAIRFVNWMNNGKGGADTETGAYTLLGGTTTPTNPETIVRNSHAQVWLPNLDEWYKAAYYDPNKPEGPGYWRYPTAADTMPSNSILIPDSGNSANFTGTNLQSTLDGIVKLTDVGEFENSASAYGVFDAAGNVSEWSETLVPGIGMLRAQLGGSWNSLSVSLHGANARFGFNAPAVNSSRSGFRIARVPEPTSGVMAVTVACMLLLRTRWCLKKRLTSSSRQS